METPSSISQRWLYLLDAIVFALTVVAVVRTPPAQRHLTLIWELLFGACFLIYGLRAHPRPGRAGLRPTRIESILWMGSLNLAWALMLLNTPSAVWVAFPLMIIEMHALGSFYGVGAVGVTLTIAVVHGMMGRPPGDDQVGLVLGPVIGALTAVGFVLAIEMVRKESQARQRALTELASAQALLAEAEKDRLLAGERERLAREIHDTVAQGLAGVELLLRGIDSTGRQLDPEVEQLVGRARLVTQENLAEVRRVVRALSPGELDNSDLAAALVRVGAKNSDEHLQVEVRIEGRRRSLGVPVETGLLRVAQSALANVVQHAHASQAAVTLTFLPGEVLLDIVDNGVGFDPEHPATSGGGFGLTAMGRRVEEMGGTLTVESEPGGGTALGVRLETEAVELS